MERLRSIVTTAVSGYLSAGPFFVGGGEGLINERAKPGNSSWEILPSVSGGSFKNCTWPADLGSVTELLQFTTGWRIRLVLPPDKSWLPCILQQQLLPLLLRTNHWECYCPSAYLYSVWSAALGTDPESSVKYTVRLHPVPSLWGDYSSLFPFFFFFVWKFVGRLFFFISLTSSSSCLPRVWQDKTQSLRKMTWCSCECGFLDSRRLRINSGVAENSHQCSDTRATVSWIIHLELVGNWHYVGRRCSGIFMGVGRWDSFITTSLQLLPNVQVSLMSQIPSILAYVFPVFF